MQKKSIIRKTFTVAALILTAILASCSSGTDAEDSILAEYHKVFRYMVATDGSKMETMQSVMRVDAIFYKDNTLDYFIGTDAKPDYESVMYVQDTIGNGTQTFSFSKYDDATIKYTFYPKASDLEGPLLMIVDYSNKYLYMYVTTSNDFSVTKEAVSNKILD